MLTSLFVHKGVQQGEEVLIKSLNELKGYNTHQCMMEFPNKGWKKKSAKRLLHKLRNDGFRFNGHFPGEPGLAGFIGTKDDRSGGEKWSYKT